MKVVIAVLALLTTGIGVIALAVKFHRNDAVAGYAVWVKPKAGHYIFGIPPVPPETMTMVSEASRVELLIDGKSVGELQLGDPDPQLKFQLVPGAHNFQFVADIVAHGSIHYSGRCSGVLQVGDGQTTVLRPWLDFSADPADPTRQHLTTCELIPW